jgi:hypothetical protein
VLLLIDSTCQGLLKLSLEDLGRKKENRHIKARKKNPDKEVPKDVPKEKRSNHASSTAASSMGYLEEMAKAFSEAVAAQIAKEMAVAMEPLTAAVTEGSKQTEAMNRTLQGAFLVGTMTAAQEQEGMTAFPDATMIQGEDTCWHLADQGASGEA